MCYSVSMIIVWLTGWFLVIASFGNTKCCPTCLAQMSKKELLSLDFEGILKYFRVSLPKKYRNEDMARQLFKIATATKVKKIKKYEKEYLAIKGWMMFTLFYLSIYPMNCYV